ncbi:MAG: RNA polymerase sigma factor [Dehalococcoidia bacterium]
MIEAETGVVTQSQEVTLLQAAANEDSSAYEQFMLRYERLVFRLAYLLLRDTRRATEVARRTFLRGYASLETVTSSESIVSWLLRKVLEDPAVHQWRTASSARVVAAFADPLQFAPEVAVVLGPQNRAVLNGLTVLLHEDQLLLYLRYFLELDFSDVAQIVGRTEADVSARFNPVLRQLESLLAGAALPGDDPAP